MAAPIDQQAGLISVIVPVYNAESHLPRCLESLCKQTYQHVEIILIDDGSTDNSGNICEFYARDDKRICVIHIDNSGPAAARNIGLQEARGELFFFLDADDHLEHDAFTELHSVYEKNPADIIVGDFSKIRSDHSVIEHPGAFAENQFLRREKIIDYVRRYLTKPNRHPLFTYSWGRLFRASIVREYGVSFDESLHTFEDVAFNFDYLKYCDALFYLKKSIYVHLINDSYTSASLKIHHNPESLFDYRKAMKKASEFLSETEVPIDIEREVGHAYTCYTIIQMIRMCGQISPENKDAIRDFMNKMINEADLRKALTFYSPGKGDSRIIPLLIRLKLVPTLMWFCQHKANKRYRKK